MGRRPLAPALRRPPAGHGDPARRAVTSAFLPAAGGTLSVRVPALARGLAGVGAPGVRGDPPAHLGSVE